MRGPRDMSTAAAANWAVTMAQSGVRAARGRYTTAQLLDVARNVVQGVIVDWAFGDDVDIEERCWLSVAHRQGWVLPRVGGTTLDAVVRAMASVPPQVGAQTRGAA